MFYSVANSSWSRILCENPTKKTCQGKCALKKMQSEGKDTKSGNAASEEEGPVWYMLELEHRVPSNPYTGQWTERCHQNGRYLASTEVIEKETQYPPPKMLKTFQTDALKLQAS
jgi:hypothetical protein